MQPFVEFALKAVAIVGVAGIVYLAVGFVVTRKREVCPACGTQRLRRVQFIRATVLIDGKRAPDSWSYFECEACGAHRKQHRGKFAPVADQEWEQYCGVNRRNA